MSQPPKRRFTGHNYPNAGLLKRLAAMFYDSILVLALWMLIGAITISFNSGEAVQGPWFNSLLLITTYSFFAFFWLRSGQTLGMTAWRLRVEDSQGNVLTLPQTLMRFMGALVSFLLLGLGYWALIISPEKIAWHDRWTNTRVVQLPKSK